LIQRPGQNGKNIVVYRVVPKNIYTFSDADFSGLERHLDIVLGIP
jgi:hypothetical protein